MKTPNGRLLADAYPSVASINSRFGTSITMVEQNVGLSLAIVGRALMLETGRLAYAGGDQPLRDHVDLTKLF